MESVVIVRSSSSTDRAHEQPIALQGGYYGLTQEDRVVSLSGSREGGPYGPPSFIVLSVGRRGTYGVGIRLSEKYAL